MTKTWFASDLHLGHTNTWAKFTKQDGTPLRPFTSTEEMDQTIINNFKKRMEPPPPKGRAPQEPIPRLYLLGDCVINRKYLWMLGTIYGRKKLIMGNHDIFDTEDYMAYFDKLLSSHKMDAYLFSHIPLHPKSLPPWCIANIHGHLHANVINDPRYLNVSVEQCDFGPIDFEEVKDRVVENQRQFKKTGKVWNRAYADQNAWKEEGMSNKGAT